MIATSPADVSSPEVQRQFSAALPSMQRAIQYHARRVPRSARDEFEADVLAACWHAWHGLVRRGKDPLAVGPAGIVTNAVRYVLNGRRLGTGKGGRNVMDVFNRKAQQRLEFQIVSIDRSRPEQPGTWRNLLRSDRGFTPADAACFRVDFEQWLDRLSDRKRKMAELLAEGHETGVVARLLGVTPAAVSIARAWLATNWRTFQGDDRPADEPPPSRPRESNPASEPRKRGRKAYRSTDTMSDTAGVARA